MKNILFGLFPALMWGIQPIIMTKIGGKATRKVMGMSLGIFIASLIVLAFTGPRAFTKRLILISFIDGLTLSYGLVHQIKGFELLGIAKGTPVSTGTQLIGATLVGAIYFKEWTSVFQYALGVGALVIIILGISMTTFEEKTNTNTNKDAARHGVKIILVSSVAFVIYTVIPRVADISIWDALVPQSAGVLVGSFLLGKREEDKLFVKETFQHIVTGFIFTSGNVVLMISNVINGLALGFTLTQMSVVVSTIGGLLILKESKTKKELNYTMLGLILIVIGVVLIGFTKV